MKSKNCRSTHLGLIQFRYPTSPIWRRLCNIWCIAGPHVRWLVGSGECSFGMIVGGALVLWFFIILQQLLRCQFLFSSRVQSRIGVSWRMFWLLLLLSRFYWCLFLVGSHIWSVEILLLMALSICRLLWSLYVVLGWGMRFFRLSGSGISRLGSPFSFGSYCMGF